MTEEMSFSTVPLVPNDLSFITELYGSLRKETDQVLVPAYCAAFTKEFLQTPWQDLFEHPSDYKGWKICHGDKPIGLMRIGKLDEAYSPYLQAPLPEATGELHEIYLSAESKGKGIGRSLYEMARRELISMGYRNMFIATYANNEAAKTFYLHRGAKNVGEGTFEQVLKNQTHFIKVAFLLHREI